MTRLVDVQTTKLAWVATIADPAAPKAATELKAASTIDLTCFMSVGYSAGFEGSNTITERAACEGAESIAPTTKKYNGNFILFRDYTAGVPTALVDPLVTFAGNFELGYFVRRTGLPYTTDWASGQIVEVYKFIADVPQLTGGTDSGYFKATIPMLAQGVAVLKATVAT